MCGSVSYNKRPMKLNAYTTVFTVSQSSRSVLVDIGSRKLENVLSEVRYAECYYYRAHRTCFPQSAQKVWSKPPLPHQPIEKPGDYWKRNSKWRGSQEFENLKIEIAPGVSTLLPMPRSILLKNRPQSLHADFS